MGMSRSFVGEFHESGDIKRTGPSSATLLRFLRTGHG